MRGLALLARIDNQIPNRGDIRGLSITAVAIHPKLLDLGRDWKALNRIDQANAALLAASRGGEPCAAEAARELLPARYPYVYEFRRALDLDTANVELPRAGLSVPSHEPQRGGRA